MTAEKLGTSHKHIFLLVYITAGATEVKEELEKPAMVSFPSL